MQGTLVKVLVVEDEPRLAVSIRRGLVRDGSVVELAGDGEQALWILGEQGFDAIILDIMLPKVDGFEVCRRLRASGDWTPILMLTAKDADDDLAHALDTGADDYLTKPFSFVVLTARLRALTRRGPVERPTVLTVDDLVLDPAMHRCQRGSVDIALTPKEFVILEHLMRHEDRIVSKAELLGHAWDFAYDGDANIVEVYLSAVRRKVDTAFRRHNIRTVRGVGYQIHTDTHVKAHPT